MPVVKLYKDRLVKLVGGEKRDVLQRLPYIGLDIEGEESDSIRVETVATSSAGGAVRAVRTAAGTGSATIQVPAYRGVVTARYEAAAAAVR